MNIRPAKFNMVEETVLVREASKKLEVIPATYETVTEQVLEKPEYTVFRKDG